MAELPPSEESHSLEDDPNFRAHLAFFQLDKVLEAWMHEHPNVTGEDVDRALNEFRSRLAERDASLGPETGD